MGIATFPAASAGVTKQQTDFTSSGTWTAPAGVVSAEFLVVGAGGAGGGIITPLVTQYSVGAGGGGGGVKIVNLVVTPGTAYTITVGAKGNGSSVAIGGDGGSSEVLNGATSLIKATGGQAGAAITISSQLLPTPSSSLACGGGGVPVASVVANKFGGGGGGAGESNFIDGNNAGNGSMQMGAEGGSGRLGATSNAFTAFYFGGSGVNGYGAGGSGGVTNPVNIQNVIGAGTNAGLGASRTTTGVTAGGAALANTGCGGGGAAAQLSTSSVAGGNGSDGLVRVVYFG